MLKVCEQKIVGILSKSETESESETESLSDVFENADYESNEKHKCEIKVIEKPEIKTTKKRALPEFIKKKPTLSEQIDNINEKSLSYDDRQTELEKLFCENILDNTKLYKKTLTGAEINIYGLDFFKLINNKFTHHGYKFKKGLNIDKNEFDPNGTCRKGGFYFTCNKYLIKYKSYGQKKTRVVIPDDALVYIEEYKMKCDKFIIKDFENIVFPETVKSITLSCVNYELKDLFQYMTKTQDLCDYVINHYPELFKYVPKEYQTNELCIKAVTSHPDNLIYICDQTKELCDLSLEKSDYKTIIHVNTKFLTDELYNKCAEKDGMLLQYMFWQTYEICNKAVHNNITSFKFVEDEFKTEELCKYAIYKNHKNMEYIKKEKITMDLCKFALTYNISTYKYIPDHLKTEELFKYIVTVSLHGIKKIPIDKLTVELCMLSVESDPSSFMNINKSFQTVEMCLLALKHNPSFIQYIRKDLQTKEMCEMVVKHSNSMIKYIRKDLQTPEMIQQCLEANPKFIRHFHEYNSNIVDVLIEKYKVIFDKYDLQKQSKKTEDENEEIIEQKTQIDTVDIKEDYFDGERED